MEGTDMAALVRHDAGAAALQFVTCDTQTRGDARELERLYAALDCVSEQHNPRTVRLLAAGRAKLAQKLMEEAGEVAIETVRRRPRALIRESADLLYQLVVLWHESGVTPNEVWAEMRYRADTLGIAEKLPKATAHDAPASGCHA
jgi:phosphoribosyl-ATP pyrophosphohydrolase